MNDLWRRNNNYLNGIKMCLVYISSLFFYIFSFVLFFYLSFFQTSEYSRVEHLFTQAAKTKQLPAYTQNWGQKICLKKIL